MTSKLLLSPRLGLGLFLVTSGCNSTQSEIVETNTSASPGSSDLSGHAHGDHSYGDEHQASKTEMEEMSKALSGFSEKDRNSVMKQHFCPVSGKMMGTIGEPEEVEVQGKPVWICCDGCNKKLARRPEQVSRQA